MALNEKECYVLVNRSEFTVPNLVAYIRFEWIDTDDISPKFAYLYGDGTSRDLEGWLYEISQGFKTVSTCDEPLVVNFKTKEFIEISLDPIESFVTSLTMQIQYQDFATRLGANVLQNIPDGIFSNSWGTMRCVMNGAVGSVTTTMPTGYNSLLVNMEGEATDNEIKSLITTDYVSNSGFLAEDSIKEFVAEVRFVTKVMTAWVENFLEESGGRTGEAEVVTLYNFPEALNDNWGGNGSFKLNLGSKGMVFPKTDRFERALWTFSLALVLEA